MPVSAAEKNAEISSINTRVNSRDLVEKVSKQVSSRIQCQGLDGWSPRLVQQQFFEQATAKVGEKEQATTEQAHQDQRLAAPSVSMMAPQQGAIDSPGQKGQDGLIPLFRGKHLVQEESAAGDRESQQSNAEGDQLVNPPLDSQQGRQLG